MTVVAAGRRIVAALLASEPELPVALSPAAPAAPPAARPLAGRPQGPTGPQAGVVPLPATGHRMSRTVLTATASLCWLGTHGGSGAGTLETLAPGSVALRGAWPALPPGPQTRIPVVLVARSHAEGLRTAQRAMTEWAAGLVDGVELLGLVVVADAPGRLPRPLRQLSRLVGGGVPACWELPWVEEWRRGAPPVLQDAPGAYRRLVAGLADRLEDAAGPATSSPDDDRPCVEAT